MFLCCYLPHFEIHSDCSDLDMFNEPEQEQEQEQAREQEEQRQLKEPNFAGKIELTQQAGLRRLREYCARGDEY